MMTRRKGSPSSCDGVIYNLAKAVGELDDLIETSKFVDISKTQYYMRMRDQLEDARTDLARYCHPSR